MWGAELWIFFIRSFMQQQQDESNRLRIALTTKIVEVLNTSSTVKVLKEGVVDPRLLQKAR